MKPVANESKGCKFYTRFVDEVYMTGCTSPNGIIHYNFITIITRAGITYAPIGFGRPMCHFANDCPCQD